MSSCTKRPRRTRSQAVVAQAVVPAVPLSPHQAAQHATTAVLSAATSAFQRRADLNARLEEDHEEAHRFGIGRGRAMQDVFQLLASRRDLTPEKAFAMVKRTYKILGFELLDVDDHHHPIMVSPVDAAIQAGLSVLSEQAEVLVPTLFGEQK